MQTDIPDLTPSDTIVSHCDTADRAARYVDEGLKEVAEFKAAALAGI